MVAPLRPPIVILFDPDHAEKVMRAAGSTPNRPGRFCGHSVSSFN